MLISIETYITFDFPGWGGVRTPYPPSCSAHGNISLSLSLFFSSDAKLLEESTALICKNLAINNCKTGNFGALIHNFLIRCTELKASAQCEE